MATMHRRIKTCTMHAVMRLLEYEAGRSLGARGCSVTRLSVYIGLKKKCACMACCNFDKREPISNIPGRIVTEK